MKYKVSETPLALREYGRNVQEMINYAKTIEDRDRRSDVAAEIVRIMHALNPAPKDTEDFRRKMWDHLFFMADYELDIDAPYPIPEPGQVLARPKEPLAYYRGRPRYRQYGRGIELMLEKAAEMENPEKKEAYINLIANTMAQFLRNINRYDTPAEVIAEQMQELSKGKIKVKAEDLEMIDVPEPKPNLNRKQQSKSKKKPGKKRRHPSGKSSRNYRRY
jgi:hypothetical protein